MTLYTIIHDQTLDITANRPHIYFMNTVLSIIAKENKMIHITREQFFEFIKTEKDTGDVVTYNTQHYLDYYDKYKRTGSKFNLNKTSLFPFVSQIWYFYRKMYLYGFLIFGSAAALLELQDYFNECYGIKLRFELIICVLMICFNDYIYLCFAQRKILKGKSKSGVEIKYASILILFVLILSGLACLIEK
jgi:hypothetical protein